MHNLDEHQREGLAALETLTTLLQRRRNQHPTFGQYAAAELNFWWANPRPTDSLGQLFWFDNQGEPAAAAFLADFTEGGSALYDEVTFLPLFMPDATPELIAHVVDRGLAHAAEHGSASVELEVDRDDAFMNEMLASRGFTMKEKDALVEALVSADACSPISDLHDDYQLVSRADTAPRAHHMNERNPRFDELRLLQTPLYRPELDLVVLDSEDNYAGYGMFWYDPETKTGVVEPMRTKDEHQKRGLARHILTAGLDKLITAGAERISICYEPGNPASGHLYRSVGFEPNKHNDLLSGPTSAAN